MKSEAVTVNAVPAKQARAGKNWALSVVSQKGIHVTETPVEEEEGDLQMPRQNSRNRKASTKSWKKTKHLQRLQDAIKQHAPTSPIVQRIPIGITIPERNVEMVRQNMAIDSALLSATPKTPVIMVTPAGDQKPWVLQHSGGGGLRRPVSSIYSAMPTSRIPHVPHFDINEILGNGGQTFEKEDSCNARQRRLSEGSSEAIMPESPGTVRPKSQGWWNLMLSPLLRNASLASRKGRQAIDTPPVPPLPFPATEKHDSPTLSVQSDPSFVVSEHNTSPETPRRAGLASVRGSTWSRWTEWEEDRERNNKTVVIIEDEGEQEQRFDIDDEEQLVPVPPPARLGLAMEYYHACAVEQLTGEPYFECINHSCGEKAPKLVSIHDVTYTKDSAIEDPFEVNPELKAGTTPGQKPPKSPTVDGNVESLLSPNELSPNVRVANVAPIVKARPLESLFDGKAETTKSIHESESEQVKDKASPPVAQSAAATESALNPYTAPKSNDELPSIASVTQSERAPDSKLASEMKTPVSLVVEHVFEKAQSLVSLGPISPEGQKSLAPSRSVQLSDFERKSSMQYGPPIIVNNYTNHNPMSERPAFVTAETSYPDLPQRAPTAAVTVTDISPQHHFDPEIEARRRRLEKEDAVAKRVGGLWRGRGCFSNAGCMGRGGPEARTRRRWVVIVSSVLLTIIIVCIILAATLTRHGDATPINSTWLNLTGYPPMPTGILTIATPNLVAQQKQCMFLTTMWSCSVPKEDTTQLNGSAPDQPNFRFEIKFRNGTVSANMTIPVQSNTTKTTQKSASDPFTNDLFVPNPQPPNTVDQVFLGDTTDNITAPFNGEVTPFYITFMPTYPVVPSSFNTSISTSAKSLHVRQSSNSSDTTAIPAPSLAADGSAAAANLIPNSPYAINQPVRLYNRGLQDEHYGFYIYYDKSIYLSGFPITPDSWNGSQNDPQNADQDGGSTKGQAVSRCTFAQTRFLVKFFTNSSFGGALLGQSLQLGGPPDISSTKKSKNTNTTSSATDFVQPGSFPYPASIILDRHGGNIDSKGVYCYGISNGQILQDQKLNVLETRDFGGTLINNPNLQPFNSSAGGIDGGTGGCSCEWQNWR